MEKTENIEHIVNMNALTVKELKEKIKDLDDNDVVYAYEGEVTGIVFISSKETECEIAPMWKEKLFLPTFEPYPP